MAPHTPLTLGAAPAKPGPSLPSQRLSDENNISWTQAASAPPASGAIQKIH
jgi:hypothetical protein